MALVFSISAGPLGHVLGQFSQAANISLSYDPALVQGKKSAGLSGAYPVDAAFQQLLQGTGLAAVSIGAEGYVLRDATSGAVGTAPLSPTTLDTVNVVGIPPEDGYYAATESLATGADTPLQKIPQSVQVIPSQVIRDQQSQTVMDILRNVPGTNNNPQTYGFNVDAYDLRGYASRLLLDGIAPQFTFRIPQVAIDRVEVLKGTDSPAMGDIAHGGVVNVMLKHPQREPVREATIETGSQGRAGASLDIADTLATNSHIQYRLILSADRADGNTAGYRGANDTFLAPSIAWDDGTSRAELGFQYSRGRLPAQPFTVLMDGRPAPISSPIGNKNDHVDYELLRPNFEFDHQLDANWSLHGAGSLTLQNSTEYSYFLGAASSEGYAYYQGYSARYYQRDSLLDSHLNGKFDTGVVTHKVTVGISQFATASQVEGTFSDYMADDIFDPHVPFPSDIAISSSDPPLVGSYDLRTYVQDFMTLDKRWHLMAGTAFNQTREDSDPSNHVWTPKLGLSYDVSDIVSVYAAYIRGFSIQQAVVQNGELAPPLRSKTVEAGVKFNWPDKPLDATVALFRTSQDKAIAPPLPDSIFYQLVGGGENRGVELSLQGQLAPGWQAIASYTYSDFTPSAGQVNAVPKHSASLWSTYFFRNPTLSGWGIGAGIYAQSAYIGDGQGYGNFNIPGQARTDLSLFWRRKRWDVSLGVQNVFDRTLYAGHAIATRAYLNPGRTVLLTTSYRF